MLTINGTSLSTLGFTGSVRSLPRLGGERTAVELVPGSISPVRVGGESDPRRPLRVEGWVRGDDHDDLIAKLDAIAALLNVSGDLVLRLEDIDDREWLGRLQPGPVDELGPNWNAARAQLSLEFALLGPARAQADTTHGGSSDLALGTAPSPLRITVTNGAMDPMTQLIVRIREGGAAGAVKQTLQWDGSVAVGDVFVIDAETFRVTNDGANAIGGLTAASDFPIADPRDGDDYVEIARTGGTGSTTEIRYRPRWL